MNDGSALGGAGRVLGVWIVLGAIIGAIWRNRITAALQPLFLAGLYLGASALLAPVYGGILYFGARRRELRRAARGTGTAALTLFVLGLAFFVILGVLLKALSGLR
jgi:hypothetical protein